MVLSYRELPRRDDQERPKSLALIASATRAADGQSDPEENSTEDVSRIDHATKRLKSYPSTVLRVTARAFCPDCPSRIVGVILLVMVTRQGLDRLWLCSLQFGMLDWHRCLSHGGCFRRCAAAAATTK